MYNPVVNPIWDQWTLDRKSGAGAVVSRLGVQSLAKLLEVGSVHSSYFSLQKPEYRIP